MKNRNLILNDVIKMQEQNVSLEEMSSKLQHYSMNYYESLNMLHEVTHKSLEDISYYLLSQPYWQDMKIKSDQKEQLLKTEYESIITIRKKQQKHFEQAIEDSYDSLIEDKKRKDKNLRNLDQALAEIFQ